MAQIKTAQSGEYVITRNEDGAIKVAKTYDNVKGALREISKQIGFEYDENWNTQQFGKNLIKSITGEHVGTDDEASAESGEYVICKASTGSIQVYKNYDNVKGALREIAESIGFEYNPDWNTRQFGSKLIDEIN